MSSYAYVTVDVFTSVRFGGNPLAVTPEDPAKSSAAGALGGLLAALHPDRSSDFRITVEQGVEMGRPSTIDLDVRKQNGTVTRGVIGGECVEVKRGTLDL